MANLVPGDKGQRDAYQWIHLEDFSAGVYDKTWISDESPVLPAPLGAADANNTWCCMALPNGGLGPLPGISATYEYSTAFPGSATSIVLAGMAINPTNSLGPEFIYMMTAEDGTTRFNWANSTILTGGSTNAIYTGSVPTLGPGFFGTPYPTWTRMVDSSIGSPPPTPPPVLVWPSGDDDSAGGHLWAYPNPADYPPASGDYSALDLINEGVNLTGQVVCYDSRVVCFTGATFVWPGGGATTNNENIDYTDPPLSIDYGNQQTYFAAEDPFGYGAAGSISTGELFMVKKIGGGVMLQGDVDNPSAAIYLPGVQPTGGFWGRADGSELGLVYCAQSRGAHLWNGGNTSQKLSMQVRDDFFDCSEGLITNNYGFFVQRWGDVILFSNNYLYNIRTNSWWKFWPNSGQSGTDTVGVNYFHFAPGFGGNQMYASPLVLNSGQLQMLALFDLDTPASHYQWQSLPIQLVKDGNRVVDIRQLVVRASTGGTGSTFLPQIIDQTGTVVWDNGGTPIDVTTQGPISYRLNVGTGALGLYNPVLQIQCDSASGSAPIVHSIDIGYSDRALVATSN